MIMNNLDAMMLTPGMKTKFMGEFTYEQVSHKFLLMSPYGE